MSTRVFKKRYLIIPGILLLIVLILFAAPRLARHYIVKNSRELIGRRLSIDRIRINYLTGALRVRELKMFESDDRTVFASFRQLRVRIDYLPLLRNEFVIRSISLEDPFVQVMQDGSRFNFSDLLTSDSTEIKKDTTRSTPTKYTIHNIKIAGGFVKYTDIPLQHTISLDNLDLIIPGFTWNSDSANLDVGFRFVDGGGLSSGLEVNQADSTYSLRLKLDSLNLNIIEPYVKNIMKISALSGYLTSNLVINGSISRILDLNLSGENHIKDFQMMDKDQRKVISFSDLSVNIDTIDLRNKRIKIDKIVLQDPFVVFELIDSTNNLVAMINQAAGSKPDSLSHSPDTSSASAGFHYNIPPVNISGGSLHFADRTLSYPFEYNIDNLNFIVAKTDEVSGKRLFNVSGKLNGTGTFNASCILDPEDPEKETDLSLEIRQFRMKDMDAYFKHYFGFPVTGGIMNFRTENELRTKSLTSKNSIYFRRFTLAKKLPAETEYKIPLRLALGVLTDRNGIIDLKAPVKMKGDEVRIINLGRIILRIIGNLFIKAAATPINLLSGLVQADPASLQIIRLNLAEIAPDNKGIKSLDVIADILENKPLLNVDFIYCINIKKAADTLACLMTRKELLDSGIAKSGDINDIADTVIIRYIKEKLSLQTGSDSLPMTSLCRKYIGEEKLSSVIDSLKAGHTEFVKTYLDRKRNIPSERFRVVETTPDSIIPLKSDPVIRIYFTSESR